MASDVAAANFVTIALTPPALAHYSCCRCPLSYLLLTGTAYGMKQVSADVHRHVPHRDPCQPQCQQRSRSLRANRSTTNSCLLLPCLRCASDCCCQNLELRSAPLEHESDRWCPPWVVLCPQFGPPELEIVLVRHSCWRALVSDPPAKVIVLAAPACSQSGLQVANHTAPHTHL